MRSDLHQVALSIRQPWAWAILHAGKDIENRDWHTASTLEADEGN